MECRILIISFYFPEADQFDIVMHQQNINLLEAWKCLSVARFHVEGEEDQKISVNIPHAPLNSMFDVGIRVEKLELFFIGSL